MADPVHERLRLARLGKGWKQIDAARAISCSQSSVSRFESGRYDALSNERIAELAEKLGVDLAEGELEAPATGTAQSPTATGRCVSPWCPTCIPYLVQGRMCLLPVVQAGAGEAGRKHCVMCREPLQRGCAACGADVSRGAFCGECGKALVEADAEVVAEVRRTRAICADGEELLRLVDMWESWLGEGAALRGAATGGGRDR